jgi:tRNA modification GTPase
MMSTRVVRLTSATPGAIGSLLLTGPDANDLVARFFRPRYPIKDSRHRLPISAALFGFWSISPLTAEELVVCRTQDTSYELHCHGGLVVEQIIKQLVDCGCQWEREQIVDSLLGERYKTIERLAHQSLIETVTEKTAAVLLDQKRGALRLALEKISQHLLGLETTEATADLERLMVTSGLGAHLTLPWNVQLAGPPNVGKSSLMNRFLGFQRAIVHASAGTTRDLIQGVTSLDGWPVRFTDSAGIRDFDPSVSQIEQTGIERSLEAARRMDLILLIMHPGHGFQAVHQTLERTWPEKCLRVLNQCDTISRQHAEQLAQTLKAVPVSAVSGDGIKELLDQVITKLVPDAPTPGEPILFRAELAERVKESLRELRLGNTARALVVIQQLLEE